VGDGEEVRHDGRESELFHRELKVVADGEGRAFEHEADKIHRPQVVVFERLPEEGRTESLSIVHCSLAGIYDRRATMQLVSIEHNMSQQWRRRSEGSLVERQRRADASRKRKLTLEPND
jgi:hypothetical protein